MVVNIYRYAYFLPDEVSPHQGEVYSSESISEARSLFLSGLPEGASLVMFYAI